MAKSSKDNNTDQNYDSRIKDKQKTMGLSIKEGSFAGISIYVGDNYIIPFALALHATSVEVGILNSLIGIASPTAQIVGSRMMEKHSRKRLLVYGVFFQALMWLPILLLGIFFMNNIFFSAFFGQFQLFQSDVLTSFIPVVLIIFYITYLIFGNLAGPAWFSLMGDIVPDDRRGRYFARRNLITTGIALAAVLLISWVLDYYKISGNIMIGFSIIFMIALICRLISAGCFTKHYYPTLVLEKDYYISLKKFIKDIPGENFGRFALYVALINFGQMIAGPFFSVYMLQDLSFNYSTYVTVTLSASIIGLLFFPIIGRFSDKFGNMQVLRFSSLIIPFLPILWIFFRDPLLLIIGPQILSGISWTAFNFAASNFIYDSIPQQKRGLLVAYYNFLIGFGIFFGGLTGSLMIGLFPVTFMNKFHFNFLISGIVRIIVVAFLLLRIKEVRQVPSIRKVFYFKINNIQKWLFQNLAFVRRKKQKGALNSGSNH